MKIRCSSLSMPAGSLVGSVVVDVAAGLEVEVVADLGSGVLLSHATRVAVNAMETNTKETWREGVTTSDPSRRVTLYPIPVQRVAVSAASDQADSAWATSAA